MYSTSPRNCRRDAENHSSHGLNYCSSLVPSTCLRYFFSHRWKLPLSTASPEEYARTHSIITLLALEMFPSKYKRNQKIQAYILEKTGEEKTISQINRKLADMSDQRRRPKTTHNHSLQTVEKVQSGRSPLLPVMQGVVTDSPIRFRSRSGAGQICEPCMSLAIASMFLSLHVPKPAAFSPTLLPAIEYPSTSSHFPHSLNSDSFPSVPPYDGNGAIPSGAVTDEARNLRSTNANVAHYPDAVSLQALGVNDPAHSVDPIPSADRGLTVSLSSSQKSSESIRQSLRPMRGGMDEDVHWSITTAERLSGDTDTATGDAGVAAWEGTLFGPYSSLAPSFGDFGSTATYPFVAAPGQNRFAGRRTVGNQSPRDRLWTSRR
ncbi:hypothetical protein B0H14DRAFT_2634751 [Mycena olivaceomarginata]|nr:hypothetical protein B0H14DRAFT_2634751 [Mycena olivaceomarginata]